MTNFREVNLTRNRYLRPGEWAITDANMEHGDLRPFASPQKVCDAVPNTKVLYPLPECCCLSFQECADPVKGFCYEQHFFLEDGFLRQGTEEELCEGLSCLAGPSIPNQPLATASCSGTQCDGHGVSYVRTFVSTHAGVDTESSPSRPSTIVVGQGETPNIQVVWTDTAPEDRCITAQRIYRVESDYEDGTTSMPVDGAEWMLVAELEPDVLEFFDDVPTAETTYPLTTSHPMRYAAPQELVSLTRTEDGIAVADNNRVFISMPGQAMFTFDAVVQVEDNIQAIRAIGNIIFVITDNYPVRIEYKHAEGLMNINRTTTYKHMPLRSRASLSTYATEVYWASEFMLARWSIAGYGADIKDALGGVFTREQYKRLHPASIVGTAHEFGYLLHSKKLDYSFLIENIGTDSPSLMPITYVKPDVVTLTKSGKFLYTQGNCVIEWDYRRDICDDSDLFDPERSTDCQPWSARLQFETTGKNRFKVARVSWDNRTAAYVDFSVYEGHHGVDSLLANYEVISSRGFGICGYTSADDHYVKMTSCGIVHEVRLATAFADLVGRSNQDIVG